MALKEPYCDIPCADSYLADSTIWNAASDSEKTNALFWGRTWLDTNFTCPDLDEVNPTDEVKYANALLAEDYLEGTLLDSGGSSSTRTIKRERVSAQIGTSSDIEYSAGVTNNPQQDVNALLSEQCRSKSGTGYKVITRT